MRPGTTGRLAGQQAAVNQQQYLQGSQSQSSEPSGGLNPLKMSIPQAITLVSLRLGKLENQIQNLEGLSLGESSPLQQQYDSDVISSILQRLDSLEHKTTEIAMLKQQVDLLKPAVVAVKNSSTEPVWAAATAMCLPQRRQRPTSLPPPPTPARRMERRLICRPICSSPRLTL
jgi:hypothetical protein